MNGRQKRHEAKVRAKLFAGYLLQQIDEQSVEGQPEWFQDMFLEELKKIGNRLEKSAKSLADRNGSDLPKSSLANHYKK